MGGGESDVQSQPQKVINNKSEQKNRNEGKKKKGLEAIKTAPLNIGKKKTALQGQKTNELNQKRLAVENQQVNKKIKNLKVEKEESSDEDEESENELEEGDESGSDEEIDEEQDEIEADDDSGDEEEVDEEESDEAEGSEDEESDDESEEDSPPPQEEKHSRVLLKKVEVADKNVKVKADSSTTMSLQNLQNNKLLGKNQKRFVLFVGNIPYDTNKQDLVEHFKKCGEIKHIRIPTEKKSSKPRGFAYVEVGNEESYQKCLSMHHTFLKSRRINVLYTQGGKKKGEEKKKEIKAKNMKLHAMRKNGKLAGSKKENQKRSFRRAKNKAQRNEEESQD